MAVKKKNTIVKKGTVKKNPVKFSIKKKVVKAKIVRAKPVAKVVESSTPSRARSKTGIRLVKRIRTAEGLKRDLNRLHSEIGKKK